MNYHTLSDFRVDHGNALDELLTQTLAVLMERKLITLQRVGQDGLRVRASAGAGSFRRKKKLKAYLKEARAQVEGLQYPCFWSPRNTTTSPGANVHVAPAADSSICPWSQVRYNAHEQIEVNGLSTVQGRFITSPFAGL